MISDLKPGSPNCCMVKYADDVTVLILEPTTDNHSTVCSEFNNAKSWSHTNKLLINVPTCKEIVLCKPSIKLNTLSNSHSDVELLRDVTLLGVTIDSKLNFDQHVSNILMSCNQRFYLLKLLREQGMPLSCLNVVYRAVP